MPSRDIARNLAQIVSLMKDVNAKLAAVDAGWADPPDPDKPSIRASLGEIKTQAATSTSLADRMLARLT